jgi:hypothetical protein
MANQEHLDILKQGVEVWNKWREEHPEIRPQLYDADLSSTNLSGANLNDARLGDAKFTFADLRGANLREADLRDASLYEANLSATNLSRANLTGANLSMALLHQTDLSEASLVGAYLSGATLLEANLKNADLSEATFGRMGIGHSNTVQFLFGYEQRTTLLDIDLHEVKGLETIEHIGLSEISINTIIRSQGKIPLVFLRGAGVPDIFIEYAHSLISRPIDFFTCFISYSNKDKSFAERNYSDLQNNGVRCWFAPEDMKIGDKIRPRIDESILLYDKLLLVLSENSVESTWVEKEVETAFEKERLQNKLVLFPIRLDDTVMQTIKAWAADIRRSRHIGDFRQWNNYDEYQKALNRLLRDLKTQPQKLEGKA